MRNVVIDIESFFSKDVNLRKLSTLEYIRHPDFRVFGVAIKFEGEDAKWVEGHEFEELAETIDWNQHRVITHNALFDLTVLFEHYGIVPGDRVDTIGLCRASLPRDLDFSLDKIGPFLGFQGKKGGGKALEAVKGVEYPTDVQLEQLGDYAIVDAEICYGIFKLLYNEVHPFELETMNLVLRMSTQGIFEVDDAAQKAFAEARKEVEDYRQDVLTKTGVSATQIRSRDKFAQLLKDRGVDPPTKISDRTGKETWAFSKNNPEFVALRADPRCQDLVEARLAWASNAAITRIDRLVNIGNLEPYTIPVLLAYGGAKTGRFAGSGGINCVSGDTEVFTQAGWKPIAQVNHGEDQALTWDINTDVIGWETAKVITTDAPDTWVQMTTQSGTLAAMYTPNHRVPSAQYHEDFNYQPAEALTKVKCDLKHKVGGYYIDGRSDVTPAVARVYALIQADSHVSPKGGDLARFTCSFFAKPRKVERCRRLLNEAGLVYHETQRAQRVHGKDYLHACFVVESGQVPSRSVKYLGPWLLDLSREALDAFIDEAQFWGGSTRGRSYQYSTSVRENAEWLALAAHLTGRSASPVQERVNFRGYNTNPEAKLYAVNIKPRDYVVLEACRAPITETTRKGRAYCLSTQRGGFLARRNGAIFVTGNSQNLQARGRGAGLRKGFRVRDDFTILVLDQSGIELRMNMWLAGQHDAVETIRQGGDLYKQQAAQQFGKPESEVTKSERQFGKVLELGLGYGMGWRKFLSFAATGPLGMDPMYLTENEAQEAVFGYRVLRNQIPALWRYFNDVAIPHMYTKGVAPLEYGPLRFEHETMILADKWPIWYAGLRPTEDGWKWGINGVEHNIWGGIVDENSVQGLAAMLLKEQMVDIDRELHGDRFFDAYQRPHLYADPAEQLRGRAAVIHNVHDELLIVCREDDVDDIQAVAERIMTTPPSWAKTLPLNVEGGYDQEYSK